MFQVFNGLKDLLSIITSEREKVKSALEEELDSKNIGQMGALKSTLLDVSIHFLFKNNIQLFHLKKICYYLKLLYCYCLYVVIKHFKVMCASLDK